MCCHLMDQISTRQHSKALALAFGLPSGCSSHPSYYLSEVVKTLETLACHLVLPSGGSSYRSCEPGEVVKVVSSFISWLVF